MKQTKQERAESAALGILKEPVRNSEATGTDFVPHHGLALSPVRRRSPADLKPNPDNDFDPLPPAEFEQLKREIADVGVVVPLIARQNGILIAGHNRLKAVTELNADGLSLDLPVQFVEQDLSPQDERRLIDTENLFRRHLSTAERSMRLARLYADTFEHSGRGNRNWGTVTQLAIAKETGLDAATIKRAKALHKVAQKIAKADGRKKLTIGDYRTAAKQKKKPTTKADTTAEAQATLERLGRIYQQADGRSRAQIRKDVAEFYRKLMKPPKKAVQPSQG